MRTVQAGRFCQKAKVQGEEETKKMTEKPSDLMGPFSFDGAEGFAFWVNDDERDISVPVRFEDLETLKKFLEHNLPGFIK